MNQHIERLTQLREQATFDALELNIVMSSGTSHQPIQFVNASAQHPSLIKACIQQGFLRVNKQLELNPGHIASIEIIQKHDTVFIASEGMTELVKRGYTGQKIILSQDEYADINRYMKKNTLYENDDL